MIFSSISLSLWLINGKQWPPACLPDSAGRQTANMLQRDSTRDQLDKHIHHCQKLNYSSGFERMRKARISSSEKAWFFRTIGGRTGEEGIFSPATLQFFNNQFPDALRWNINFAL